MENAVPGTWSAGETAMTAVELADRLGGALRGRDPVKTSSGGWRDENTHCAGGVPLITAAQRLLARCTQGWTYPS